MEENQTNLESENKETAKIETTSNQTDADDRIKVYMRVRPLLKNEVSVDYKIEDQTITINVPSKQNSSYFLHRQIVFFSKNYG